MIAPLLAVERSLAGIAVFGTWAERWLDCVVATTERKRRLDGEGDESGARRQALWSNCTRSSVGKVGRRLWPSSVVRS